MTGSISIEGLGRVSSFSFFVVRESFTDDPTDKLRIDGITTDGSVEETFIIVAQLVDLSRTTPSANSGCALRQRVSACWGDNTVDKKRKPPSVSKKTFVMPNYGSICQPLRDA